MPVSDGFFDANRGSCLSCVHLTDSSLIQFDEQKDEVAVERILRVVFLDAEHPSSVSRNLTFLMVLMFPFYRECFNDDIVVPGS